jgi:drug/metabolite transporter (DMT)-like permease
MLMLGFCILAPCGDAIAKLLGGSNGVMELVVFRFSIQPLLLVPIILFTGGSLNMSSRTLFFTVLRTVFHISGIVLMFLALRILPLAETIAIAFVMPFILMFLGWFLMNEVVGPRRIIAAGVGFLGTLLVIQPSFAEVGLPALLPVGVAFVFAFFMLATRAIAREADPITLQAVSGIIAVILLMPLWIIGAKLGWADFQFTPLSESQWGLILLLGGIGTVAHLFMTWSLRFAPSSTLAPMQYLEIPVATVIGFVVFRDLPNGLAAIGITVTIGAGLYVIYRESKQAA